MEFQNSSSSRLNSYNSPAGFQNGGELDSNTNSTLSSLLYSVLGSVDEWDDSSDSMQLTQLSHGIENIDCNSSNSFSSSDEFKVSSNWNTSLKSGSSLNSNISEVSSAPQCLLPPFQMALPYHNKMNSEVKHEEDNLAQYDSISPEDNFNLFGGSPNDDQLGSFCFCPIASQGPSSCIGYVPMGLETQNQQVVEIKIGKNSSNPREIAPIDIPRNFLNGISEQNLRYPTAPQLWGLTVEQRQTQQTTLRYFPDRRDSFVWQGWQSEMPPEQENEESSNSNDISSENSPGDSVPNSVVKSHSGSKRVEGKKCGVCGDRALGYNFNAITCESCKAFFRRNALKNKEFRCPFSDKCEVTSVTRRFCQRCRLKKCLEVGMKKEWIMSEEEKKKKKRKIEENRARKIGEFPSSSNQNNEFPSSSNQNNEFSSSSNQNNEFSSSANQNNEFSSSANYNHEVNLSANHNHEVNLSANHNHEVNLSANHNHEFSSSVLQNHEFSSSANHSQEFLPSPNLNNQNFVISPVEEKFVPRKTTKPKAVVVGRVRTDAKIQNKKIRRSQQQSDVHNKVILNEAKTRSELAKLDLPSSHVGTVASEQSFANPETIRQPSDELYFEKVNSVPVDEVNQSVTCLALDQINSLAVDQVKINSIPVEQVKINSLDQLNQAVIIPVSSEGSLMFSKDGIVADLLRTKSLCSEDGGLGVNQKTLQQQNLQQFCLKEPNGSCSSDMNVNVPELNSGVTVKIEDNIEGLCENSYVETNFKTSHEEPALHNEHQITNCEQFEPCLLGVQDRGFQFNIKETIEILQSGCKDFTSSLPSSGRDVMDSILNSAINAEYSGLTLLRNSSDSLQLNPMETLKINELLEASRGLTAPLCEDANFQDLPNPSLINVINLTEIAIRRLIKMSKKISAFKNLCQEDQLALLKAGCTEMMILRSVYAYDPDKEVWKIQQDHERFKSIKLKVLKAAPGNVYEEHKRFILAFETEWRQDLQIMALLSAIALFTPQRQNIVHPQAVEHEQKSYFFLLKRYLESRYGGCEGKTNYYRLLKIIGDLHILNEDHVRVFLEVNPKDVAPLLIEIFDLKRS